MTFADHVFPHGPLVQLAPRLWCVTGSAPSAPLPRNMVVWRMEDERLLLHSVVALDEPTMAELEALGEPAIMIVPSRFHRMDARVFAERYPAMEVLCPAAVTRAVRKVTGVDGTCEERLPALGVIVHTDTGIAPTERVYEVDCGNGRALVMTDLVIHVREHLPGLQGLFIRYVTRSTGFFGISGLGRWVLLRDRRRAKAWFAAQAEREDLAVVAMAHGEPVTGPACRDRMREAAERL